MKHCNVLLLLCLPGSHLGIGASCIPQRNARESNHSWYMSTKQDAGAHLKIARHKHLPQFLEQNANPRTHPIMLRKIPLT